MITEKQMVGRVHQRQWTNNHSDARNVVIKEAEKRKFDALLGEILLASWFL